MGTHRTRRARHAPAIAMLSLGTALTSAPVVATTFAQTGNPAPPLRTVESVDELLRTGEIDPPPLDEGSPRLSRGETPGAGDPAFDVPGTEPGPDARRDRARPDHESEPSPFPSVTAPAPSAGEPPPALGPLDDAGAFAPDPRVGMTGPVLTLPTFPGHEVSPEFPRLQGFPTDAPSVAGAPQIESRPPAGSVAPYLDRHDTTPGIPDASGSQAAFATVDPAPPVPEPSAPAGDLDLLGEILVRSLLIDSGLADPSRPPTRSSLPDREEETADDPQWGPTAVEIEPDAGPATADSMIIPADDSSDRPQGITLDGIKTLDTLLDHDPMDFAAPSTAVMIESGLLSNVATQVVLAPDLSAPGSSGGPPIRDGGRPIMRQASPVPEPTTLTLAVLVIAGVALRWGQRRWAA